MLLLNNHLPIQIVAKLVMLKKIHNKKGIPVSPVISTKVAKSIVGW
jgi:hypothetical protein